MTTTQHGSVEVTTLDDFNPKYDELDQVTTTFRYRYRDDSGYKTNDTEIPIKGWATPEQIDTILASLTGFEGRCFDHKAVGFDDLRPELGPVRSYDPKTHELMGIEIGYADALGDETLDAVVAGFVKSGKKIAARERAAAKRRAKAATAA